MDQKPAWLVMFLMGLLAALMVAQLSLLALDAWECDRVGRALIQKFEDGALPSLKMENPEDCAQIEETFSKTVDQWIALILALLSGAGFSAGVAAVQSKKKEGGADEPPADQR